MSAWIGPLGSLIEFKCPSAVESSSEDPHVYFRPLGGDVSVSTARPDDVATLEALGAGAFGPGPFVFIPPAAETLNLLGKRSALGKGTPPTGYAAAPVNSPVLTPEGWVGSYYGTTTAAPALAAFGDAPAVQGQPVTGRAFVQALSGTTASLRVTFHSAGHTQLGVSTTATTTSTTGEYLHTTTTAPAGTAYARLWASGAIIAHPQITWTPQPRTWSPSKATTNAVASPLSDSVRRATGQIGEETITDHRFTVTELRA